MRIFARCGLFAAALGMFALACGEPRPQRPATHPEPQQAVNAPSIQQPVTNPEPQRPIGEVLQEPMPSPGPQEPISNPQPQRPFYGEGATAPGEQAAKTERPLTDAQVLGVTEAAHRGEVQMADLALKRATSPDVKRFATMMKTMHQKALDKAKKVEHEAKLTPAESDAATTLKGETEEVMKALRDERGHAFDVGYMDAQVKAHRDLLDVIDNRLVPSAQNPELKTMLTGMRSTVAEHLTHAEEARTKVESGARSGAETKGTHRKAKTPANPHKHPVPAERR